MKLLLILLAIISCVPVKTDEPPQASLTTNPVVNISKVLEIVVNSSCKSTSWKERGHLPIGFYKGMALLYAKHFCIPNETTKHFNGPVVASNQDILSIYNKTSMRDLFTLALSSGAWESSGRYCVGRDMSANFSTSDSAEAGLFQTSWGVHIYDSQIDKLLAQYGSDKRDCGLEIYQFGTSPCSDSNLHNWGSGDGLAYQALSKTCPNFHAEVSLIAMRKHAREYGPLRSGSLEFNQNCSDMFKQIEATCL